MVRFAILGSFEIFNESGVCELTAPKLRQVLALLLVRRNQLVTLETVVEELWGADPPKSAQTTAQTYIYQLRKTIESEGLAPDSRELLVTRPSGYMLRVEPTELDLFVFDEEVKSGRRLLEVGRLQEAARQLRDALALWTGPPLAGVNRGPLLEAYAAHLQEQRLYTLELRIKADMLLGRDRELIGELRSLVAAHPFNEWFHGQLIMALSRAGRRNEALDVFHSLRHVLDNELGLLPSPEIQEIHQNVLLVGKGPAGG
ncbi:AfsR/SARP family transcriptional regulator [Actinomadura soli]|uniref:AfsR/SARP family transcriptional regulator n=1 Tax=Actinomadura soli TaxID=2508997 RepID=A0A5C4JEJ0_9ACTN|nr:AfsR/SARP family transcriptional regulator [Actinomadura soli]